MSRDVVLVAEAHPAVGLGHLAETRTIADALRARGVAVARLAVGDAGIAGADVTRVPDFAQATDYLAAWKPRAVGWSVRTDGWRACWDRVSAVGARHAWVADVAGPMPPVDVLIVPTLAPSSPDARAARVCAGPEYFPLDRRGPADVVPLGARRRDVLLTLGGADPTSSSLRIAPALAGTRSTVVVGPLFRHRDELQRIAADADLETAVAPDGLRGLLLQHRIVICAGGNTLYEAAAAGTPALVAWDYLHEEAQGRAFSARGTAQVLGRGVDVEPDTVARTVRALLSSPELETMNAAGPGIVDGHGADRIAGLLIDLTAGVAA